MPKVLAAIDGSEHAMQALSAAADMFGESVDYVLVSVVPPWSPAVSVAADAELDVAGSPRSEATPRTHGTSTGTTPYAPTADAVTAAKDALYDHYRAAQRRAASNAGITAEHVMEEARPQKRRIGRAICECAEEHDVDAIVVGSHGSSHTGEVLLGSVSQYVLHHATCPVLVVRHTRRPA